MSSGFTRFQQLMQSIVKNPMEVIVPLANIRCHLSGVLGGPAPRAARFERLDGAQPEPHGRGAVRSPARAYADLGADPGGPPGLPGVRSARRGSPTADRNILLVLWIMSLTLMCMRIVGDLVRYQRQPGCRRDAGHHADAESGADLGRDSGQPDSARPFQCVDHADPDGLGSGRFGGRSGAQDTLSNLFGGFYVAVAGQVRLGDYIKLNTGEEGYVTDIGWRCYDDSRAGEQHDHRAQRQAGAGDRDQLLPAGEADGGEFRGDGGLRLRPGRGGAGAGGGAGQAAPERFRGCLQDPAPSVAFDPGFGGVGNGRSRVNFQVAEFASQGPVRNELRRRVLRRFRAEGIGIPYPARTVYLRVGAQAGEQERRNRQVTKKFDRPDRSFFSETCQAVIGLLL